MSNIYSHIQGMNQNAETRQNEWWEYVSNIQAKLQNMEGQVIGLFAKVQNMDEVQNEILQRARTAASQNSSLMQEVTQLTQEFARIGEK